MRVLIVEDDPKVSHWLNSKLQNSGHRCRIADNGEDALQFVKREVFDVVLLDRMLPDISGIQVLHALQDQPHPPIMMLSAVDQPGDRIEGLRAGAEDYLGKPFDFTELQLRLEVLVRRRSVQNDGERVMEFNDLTIDLRNRKVTRAGKPVDLTQKEYALLEVLAEHRGQTVTRTMLMEKVWGYQFDPQTNLIDVHVSKLRNKLDRNSSHSLLRTIRAIGYVLD
ncbi:response regulator transcription factor [Herbaspirillum lusitanum]|uniref:Response regulator transcription factor n=1 Tax=Herbaspirillum lusitanum TaxID=213312 RepID=A0ABW9A374_9BURK